MKCTLNDLVFIMEMTVTQSCRTLATPQTMHSMEISMPEHRSGQPFASPGATPNTGIKPRSPTLHANSLPPKPPGKPKNTRLGSLSLLQRIFTNQESNRGLLHCRQILFQLNYQGSLSTSVYSYNSFFFFSFFREVQLIYNKFYQFQI